MDFENVQPTLEELAKLAPGFTDLWLFHGPHQAKQVQQMAAAHRGVTLVPRSGKGPNALDFHLSFYLGYVAAKHPDPHLVVVANDRGYDPMIAHARILKFTVRAARPSRLMRWWQSWSRRGWCGLRVIWFCMVECAWRALALPHPGTSPLKSANGAS